MDEAQIMGAASSYARKYALNGLFAIDDTKDADSEETQASAPVRREKPDSEEGAKAEGKAEAELHVCPIHHKIMKERRGTNGGRWYDHRWQVEGVWQQCNGCEKG